MPKRSRRRWPLNRWVRRLFRPPMRRWTWTAVAVIALVAMVTALLVQIDIEKLVGTAGRIQPTAAVMPDISGLSDGSVMFVENVGQFDRDVRFQVHGSDCTIWLAEDALWVTVLGPSEVEGEDESLQGVNIKLSFSGANPTSRLEPFNRLDTRVSYFIGNDPASWYISVPVWGGVRYVDLYTGVDLEIAGGAGGWVWQLSARDPQFDFTNVHLQVDGADAMDLESVPSAGQEVQVEGEAQHLRLSTGVGEFTLPLLGAGVAGAPATIAGHEILNPFVSPIAQPERQTAAPQGGASRLLYATFLGGSNSDDIEDIAVDGAGSAYVVGNTRSSDFPTTVGAFDAARSGSYDAVVAKLDPSGAKMTYVTFVGGSNDDRGSGIAVDEVGSAYIIGSTGSPDFPATPGAFDTACGTDQNCNLDYRGLPGDDAFVVKLDAAGSSLEYATFLGGSDRDVADGVALGGAGSVHVVGDTRSADFPTTPGAFDTTHGGSYDAFAVKLNVTGSALEYATFLGGDYDDNGEDIAVDGAANVYVTGFTDSENFPTTPGAFDAACASRDVFVLKLNPAGSAPEYATCLGGRDADYGRAVVVDGQGSAHVTGSTFSPDFPTTSGAFDTTYGDGDVFVVKLDPAGSALEYATFVGGSETEFGRGAIALDGAGNAYVAGDTQSGNFVTTSDAFDDTHNGSYDAFVVRLNRTGSALAYATFLGGSESDRSRAIAVDGAGDVYVAGYTASTDFPITPGAFDTTHSGGINYAEGFAVKLTVPSAYYYAVSGRVTDGDGNPLSGVTVSDAAGRIATTDSDGRYTLSELEAGIHTVMPPKSGDIFFPVSRMVSVPPDAADQNFILQPGPVSTTLTPGLDAGLIYTDAQGLPTRLEIPAGAVTQEATLILTPTLATTDGADLAFAGHAFDLAVSQKGSSLPGFTFSVPVTFSIHYSGADAQAVSDEGQLALLWRADGGWADAVETCAPPTNYDRHPDEDWLTVAICQLGRFGLFGPAHRVHIPIVLRNR